MTSDGTNLDERWYSFFQSPAEQLVPMPFGTILTRLATKPTDINTLARGVRASMSIMRASGRPAGVKHLDGRVSVRWGTWRSFAAEQKVTMKPMGGYSVQWVPPTL